MAKNENIAFRDKTLHKYYFVISLFLLLASIFSIIFINSSKGISLTKIILLVVVALIFCLFNLILLFSPKIAISTTPNGLIIRKLFKKLFISYENFTHASCKLRISKYNRDDNPLVLHHNKKNEIGTLYVVYDITNGISKTITLFSILEVQTVELMLNSLKQK